MMILPTFARTSISIERHSGKMCNPYIQYEGLASSITATCPDTHDVVVVIVVVVVVAVVVVVVVVLNVSVFDHLFAMSLMT